MNLVTDNKQQEKRNKTYADIVENITDNSELYYKTKSDDEVKWNTAKINDEVRRAEKRL